MSARTVVWVTAVAPVGETTRLPRLGIRGLINLSSNAGSRWARPSSVSECRGQISLRSPNVACRDLAALSQVILQLRGISSSLCGRCCWSALTRRTSDWGVGRYGESVPLLHINRTLGQKRTPPVSTGLQAIRTSPLPATASADARLPTWERNLGLPNGSSRSSLGQSESSITSY
jgi:hypothetical protein